MVAVDLRDPSLAGSTAETLLSDLTLGASPRVVREVWIGGQHVVRGGWHPEEDAIVDAYRGVMKALVATL